MVVTGNAADNRTLIIVVRCHSSVINNAEQKKKQQPHTIFAFDMPAYSFVLLHPLLAQIHDSTNNFEYCRADHISYRNI